MVGGLTGAVGPDRTRGTFTGSRHPRGSPGGEPGRPGRTSETRQSRARARSWPDDDGTLVSGSGGSRAPSSAGARCDRPRHRRAGVTGTPGGIADESPAAVAWRVGWSGPGRAAGVARTVAWGVAADRTGPDRVGSRAWRSGAAARAALARGREPSFGRRRPEGAGHDRPTASDRVSGLWGSRQILGDGARGSWHVRSNGTGNGRTPRSRPVTDSV